MRITRCDKLIASAWISASCLLGLAHGELEEQSKVSPRDNNPQRRLKIDKRYLQRIHEAATTGGCNPESSDRKMKEQDPARGIFSITGTEMPMFMCDPNDEVCRGAAKEEQDQILAEIKVRHPEARLVSQSYKIGNSMYVLLPEAEMEYAHNLLSIPGVTIVQPSQTYYPAINATVDYVGAAEAQTKYCATGKGVKIAVLDSGIDYTHEALGGPGTETAYKLAYGRSREDVANTERGSFFPTERVYDGTDFLGDRYDGGLSFPDDDPIDAPSGHGTWVAGNIVGIAPDVKLMAIKVCSTGEGGCPDFALENAIEYALDPNGDDSIDDRVDVMNLSLGAPIYSSFYNSASFALENAFKLGVVVVVAAGNAGNQPYVTGTPDNTANGISCAATGHPNGTARGLMEVYSSRGPSEGNYIKPDISAPSRSTVAVAGTGDGYASVAGTSFSAPVVAGAVALLIEKCPDCSPLAIKALLMNNVERDILYLEGSSQLAPISLGGAGELRILKSLEAEFWAYSPDEGNVQPSLSLGLVDAASDMVIKRTIIVKSITDAPQTLQVKAIFRDKNKAASGALSIVANPSTVVLDGCPGETSIEVEFRVFAKKAPSNFMGSGGRLGSDPLTLDKQEFGGHILIESLETGKGIGLPFLMLLRKAAQISVSNKVLPPSSSTPTTTRVTIENNGAGIAQIDAYNLLTTSADDPEAPHGVEDDPGDLRAFGYRTLEVGEPSCSYLLEFAVSLWERQEHFFPNFAYVALDINMDDEFDYVVLSWANNFRQVNTIVWNVTQDERTCSGFPVDHATNSANVILRVCSEDVGLSPNQTRIQAAIFITSIPSIEDWSDVAGYFLLDLPEARMSANSFNIGPGEVLEDFEVRDTGSDDFFDRGGLGLQLITNAYRGERSTGAATGDTEVVLLLKEGVREPVEMTPDGIVFPDAEDTTGPECLWLEDACNVPSTSPTITNAPSLTPETLTPTLTPAPSRGPTTRRPSPLRAPTCTDVNSAVPRETVPTKAPTVSPAPTLAPSAHPSERPSLSIAPTLRPSSGPTSSPSTGPTSSPSTSPAPSSAAAIWTVHRGVISNAVMISVFLSLAMMIA